MASALVTGTARRAGIGAACALELGRRGWDIGLSCWGPVGVERVTSDGDAGGDLIAELRALGVRAESIEVDLGDPAAPADLVAGLEQRLGPPTALVAAHCRDIESPLLQTSAEEFDRHFAVNARSVALLIQEFARRVPEGSGHIVAFTSDALAGNVPYGVSKGALDRIVKAAALELGPRGIRANCINPGPTETGWISDDLRTVLARQTPLGRTGVPQDAANLVAFLLSPEGGWITGQLLHSNGGFQ